MHAYLVLPLPFYSQSFAILTIIKQNLNQQSEIIYLLRRIYDTIDDFRYIKMKVLESIHIYIFECRIVCLYYEIIKCDFRLLIWNQRIQSYKKIKIHRVLNVSNV